MKEKLITEFIGTFFLYLIIALSAVSGAAGDFAPLAIGLGLAALIFASGHRSKAHFNPAVTLAFLFTKNQKLKESAAYTLTAIVAVLFAAFSAQLLSPKIPQAEIIIICPFTAILAEFIFTFILVWVILNVAVSKGTQGNGFYGIAIGFTVASGAYCVGSISGASFNPAVSIGLLINNVIDLKTVLLYSLVQLFAGFIAAKLFNCLEQDKVT